MSVAELKAFDAVARAGGFTRAAALLRRGQPTITAQVRALEEKYAVELFFRSRGQTARLTPLGERLFETTRAMFQLEEDATSILEGAERKLHGVFRLGLIAPRSSMELVSRFSALHPNIAVELRFANSGAILDALRNYEIDVGILGAHDQDPIYFMETFAQPEIVLLARNDPALFPGGFITRTEFARQTLLNRERGSETRALIEAAMARHNLKPARVFEIGSREGVIAAAEAGLGLAPISLAEIDPSPKIKILRFADAAVRGEMFMVCMNARRHIPMIRDFFALKT
ncbi:MAG: LysR substrate-binding domain-containing protein [Beijerinckiaceae bacterium]